ncbi:MAG: STAS domain-containing protein [Pseudomonadota bacterium]
MAKQDSVPNSQTVHLQEEVVLDGVKALKDELSATSDTAEVVIEASDARFIDAAGWQLIVAFFKSREGVSLVNATESVHQQAATLGIDKILPLGEAAPKAPEVDEEDDLCPVF